MKNDYEQIFKRDPESGKIVIEISLNDYLEFFHEWDNAVFKKRDMHPELAEFLEECSRDIPSKEALDVRFYLADEPRDPQKEEVIRSSYRNYFDAALSFEEGEVKRTVYGSGAMLLIALTKDGKLRSSEFDLSNIDYEGIIVGRCCESGDSQCLDSGQNIVERTMAEPEIGDLVVIGGAGAYCAAMTPFNYNSHTQAPEVLAAADGSLKLIRKPQTLEQIVENEL